MSDERYVEGSPGTITSEEFDKYTDDQLVHKFIDIAERGVVGIRTNVELPPDVHGEWCSNTPEDIAAAQMMGFQVDNKYAIKSALHSDGKGNPIIGDVIHMICSKRVKEAHDKAQRVLFVQTHGTPKNLTEEREFEGNIKSLGLQNKYRNSQINTSIQEKVSAGSINASLSNGE